MLDPLSRPKVQLIAILRLLAEHRVRWVLTGSTVLAVYGADLVPNDIDVVPALDDENLARLAQALRAVDAVPAHHPDWDQSLTTEQCRGWSPKPATEQNLDHLFVTRLGVLDVPPRICGTYDELLPAAATIDVAGIPVLVCDPQQVLDRLEGRTRSKDLARAAAYAHVRCQAPLDRRPVGVERLLARS